MASYSDNFNRANGEIGANWIEDLGDTDIVDNEAVPQDAGGDNQSRYASALDSADHYSQCKASIDSGYDGGPIARVEDSDVTYYSTWYVGPSDTRLIKREGGSWVELDTYAGDGDMYKVEVDGATQEGSIDGTVRLSDTDPAISAGLYAGMIGFQTRTILDDWSAEDLAVGAIAIITGTIIASITEADIIAGNKTIIMTLTDETWIAE